MTTGRDSSETRRLTLEAGAAGFLANPFSAHDLLALVRTVAGDPSSTGAVPPLGSAEPHALAAARAVLE